MKISAFQFAIAALLALAAGCIGAFAIGEWRGVAHPQTLHDFIHEVRWSRKFGQGVKLIPT